MEDEKRYASLKARRLLAQLKLGEISPTDPQGSYTGRPEQGSVPVQDADDL